LPPAELTDVVVESARLFSRMGIDVLKSEFPVDVIAQPDEALWQTALARLDAACAVPWALLSAGAPWATFRRQAELACAAGASGVIVGRAVWAEAATLPLTERETFLRGEGRARMAELAAICAASARDFRDRTPPPPPFGPDWQDTP
jgi:tagatose-1,6-bisphosphate aldolase